MPDEAVLDAPVEAVNSDIQTEESTQSTDDVSRGTSEQDKSDNRRAPDALRKHIADLKRQADAITDPVEKKAAQDRIKLLYDTTGKARGYEEQFPTVREAREVKALLDAVGGREGFQQMQATLSEVEQVDQALSAGDPSVVERMWNEAPDGMPKLMPALLDKFAATKPEDFAKTLAPHSLDFIEKAGFNTSLELIFNELQQEKPSAEKIYQIAKGMADWFASNRQTFKAQQQKQTDPEVERLRQELAKRDQGAESQRIDTAYNAVVQDAGPAIDAVAKPLVAKLKLSAEEYKVFRGQVWEHLQSARNADSTYKTVGPAKAKAGYDQWAEYAKRWTKDNAETSIRAILKTPPWSRLASTPGQATVTRAPGAQAVAVTQGKEPAPSEIDYGPKGIQAAKKAGFRDLADMILSGQAPLKAGGLRKWR